MRKWMVVALCAGLWATPVLADVSKSPGTAHNKLEKTEALSWPLPWKAGTTLTYDETYESTKRKGERVERISGATTTQISVVKADEQGFLQRWRWSAGGYRFDNIDPAQQAILNGLAGALKGVPLDVRLDRDGAFESIANIEQFQPVIREHLEKALKAGVTEAAAKANANPQKLAEANARLAPMLEMLSGKEFVSGLLSKSPQAYNFMGAGGLVLDEEVEYEDLGQNPFGGEPIPMLGKIKVSRKVDAPGFVEAHWTVTLHPTKSVPIFTEAVKKLLGSVAPEQSDAVSKAMPKSIDISTEVTFLIDTATGIVHRMARAERKNIGDKQETESTTLTLRKQ